MTFAEVFASGTTFKLSRALVGSDRVRFRMSSDVPGYVSVAFAPASVKVAHSKMDTIVGWVGGDGGATVVDSWSDSKSASKDDVKLMSTNDVEAPSGSLVGGVLTIEFTRRLDTRDNKTDVVLSSNATVLLQWAVYGKPCSPTFACGKHSSAGVVGQINLLQSSLTPAAPPVEPYGGLQAGDLLLVICGGYLVLVGLLRWLFKCLRFVSARKQYAKHMARVTASHGALVGGDVPRSAADIKLRDWLVPPPMPSLYRQSAYATQDVNPQRPVYTVVGEGGAWAPPDPNAFAFAPSFRPLPPPPPPLAPDATVPAPRALARRTVRFADDVKDAWNPQLDAPRESRYAANRGHGDGAARKSARCTVYELAGEEAVRRPGLLSNLLHAMLHARVLGSPVPVYSVGIALVFVLVSLAIVFIFPGETWNVPDSLGYMAGAVGLLTALPATRNSLLCWLLDMHFDATIMYHRWLGRYAVALALAHFIAYFAAGVEGWAPPDGDVILTEKYLFGIVALLAGLWIIVSSVGYVRRNQFEFFYWSHFAFIAWYVFAGLHSSRMAIYSFVAAALYGLDRLIRFFWGLWPRRTTTLTPLEGGAIKVRWPKHPWATFHVGNYVFLNFPKFSLVQWHPFTLASSPSDAFNEVVIKSLGDFTGKLNDVVKTMGPAASLWLRCDGPYGRFTIDYHRFETIIVVGGGVGVTPCIAMLREIYRVDMSAGKRAEQARHTVTKNVFFVWSCTNVTVYEWFRDVVERSLAKSERTGYAKLHLYVYATREKMPPAPMIAGRPDLDAVFDAAQDVTAGAPVATFVCGPDQMVEDVHSQCLERTAAGPVRFFLHSEQFSF